MKRILLTGFEPFGGDSVNASWQAVARAAELWDSGDELIICSLPVVFARAEDLLTGLLDEHHPELVVAVGEASERTGITPERIAVNRATARIPDNDGQQPQGQHVIPDAPAAYPSGLPLAKCVVAIEAVGVPAAISESAGAFVCNATFFLLMHEASGRQDLRAGFVHVPAVRGRDGEPGIDDLARGLVAMLSACMDRAD